MKKKILVILGLFELELLYLLNLLPNSCNLAKHPESPDKGPDVNASFVLFTRADSNEDGRITREEVQEVGLALSSSAFEFFVVLLRLSLWTRLVLPARWRGDDRS